MSYCVVEYGGGYSTDIGEVYVENSSVKINNSTIRNSASPGISLNDGGKFVSLQDNVIMGNATYPVSIYASSAHTIGTGNTMDNPGIYVYGETVASNVTWLKQMVPYILDGTTYVGSTTGNTLTIAPGTVIEFTQGSEMDIGYNSAGTLVAQGDASDSITFTSAAPAGNKSPGD